MQNVPFMVGYDTHEGILFTFDNPLPKFLEGDYGMLVPVDLNISENALEYPLVKDSIKNFYYGNNSNQTELYFNYTDVSMKVDLHFPKISLGNLIEEILSEFGSGRIKIARSSKVR